MSDNTVHSSSMSRSDSAPGATRRDLQQLSAECLRTIASELHLKTSGQKSALVDCILRHRRQAARITTDSGPATRERSPPAPAPANSSLPSHSPNTRRIDYLHQTVQHLVDESLQGLEERLLRSLRPLAAGNTRAASDENISLHPRLRLAIPQPIVVSRPLSMMLLLRPVPCTFHRRSHCRRR